VSDTPHASHAARRLKRLEEAPNLRGANRYLLLLVLLLADIVLLFVVPADAWGTLIVAPFIATTLMIGLLTSNAGLPATRAGLVASLAVVVLAVVQVILNTTKLQGAVDLLLAALLVGTPLVILRRVFTERVVTMKLLLGALSVYLLIGLTFTFIYLGVGHVTGGFFAQSAARTPADFVYFSFITMTTVGYGDLTPLGSLPRGLAVFEALLGQIFLVTAVARLVSLYKPPARHPEDEE
jgi:hypothetical protein